MSKFFSEKYNSLVPYTPGEQPKNRKFIKLNTNESPFPPSKKAVEEASKAAENLMLYSDIECTCLVDEIAKLYGLDTDQIICSNGSDEVLNFAFMAFCDEKHPAIFANITYGFYPVFAQLNHVPYWEIPLNDDFTINTDDYLNVEGTIFIANPNAPTAIYKPLSEIEKIVQSNPDNIVVVDEAYIDFGGESAVKLIPKYENLLVMQTFSKSRSMAGARLGFCMGQKPLIDDMKTIKFSTNPYNVNSMTIAAGYGALRDEEYTRENCSKIMKTRDYLLEELRKLDFYCTDSKANFVFAKHKTASGQFIYEKLRDAGILVRHFTKPEIADFNRITIGTDEQAQALVAALKKILADI